MCIRDSDKCCGIDVHKKLIVACFRCGKKQEVREFGATTRELLELADWLKESGCEMVAMESTASYWKPLYNILESSDLNACLLYTSLLITTGYWIFESNVFGKRSILSFANVVHTL